MKVADSSYITEGLLRKKELFETEVLVTLDLALYETANAIWKHQHLLKDISDGLPYLSILHGLIESGRIRPVSADKNIIERAYPLSVRHGRPVYDTAFIALAQELGAELVTFDRRQAELMKRSR